MQTQRQEDDIQYSSSDVTSSDTSSLQDVQYINFDDQGPDDEYDFIKEYNQSVVNETTSSSKDLKETIVDPNKEYDKWDFHPNEPDPKSQYTYSTNLESLRISLNTFLKKPLLKPFQTNSKKAYV